MASLDAGHDPDRQARAAEDRLPLRQDSRTAWDDDPGYDEADLGAEYDGDLEALVVEDRLPPRQVSAAATWDDESGYDEADLGAEYDGDLDALTAEDHTTATGEEHATDDGEGDQDQDQDAHDEIPATGKPGDPPAEAPGTSDEAAPGQENGNVTAPKSSPAGASADTGSVAEADAGERPDEASQAGQADDSHANPDTAPEASLKELKSEYEASLKDLQARYAASLKDLEAEVQALKDRRQAPPDAPGNVEAGADQPHAGDRERTTAQQDATEAKDKDDRPGLWSNAKTALYGAVGTTGTAAVLGEFFPGVSPVVAGFAAGAVTIASLLVPVLRERRKGKHDDSPDES